MPRGRCPRACTCVSLDALRVPEGSGPVPVCPGLRPCPGHGTRGAKTRTVPGKPGRLVAPLQVHAAQTLVLEQMKSGGAGRAGDPRAHVRRSPTSEQKQSPNGVSDAASHCAEPSCSAKESRCLQHAPGPISEPLPASRAALRPSSLSPATRKPWSPLPPPPDTRIPKGGALSA